MYAQPGPGPSAGTPSEAKRGGQEPKRDGRERESRARSFGEWVTTTQGIITIIATLIGLIVGGSAVVININVPGKPSPTPSPQTSTPQTPATQPLTVDQVRAALLTPADLVNIDPNLTYQDIAVPSAVSCAAATVKPLINVIRQYTDGTVLKLADEIEVYSSANAAHTALAQDAQQITCSLTEPYSISNISSQLNGMCAENDAWQYSQVNNNGTDVSGYLGAVRCGRALVIFFVATVQGSSWDNTSTLVNGMEIAVPKVQSLL
jgi:hypothetical protein